MIWLLPRPLLALLSLVTGGVFGHLAGASIGLPEAGAVFGAALAAGLAVAGKLTVWMCVWMLPSMRAWGRA